MPSKFEKDIRKVRRITFDYVCVIDYEATCSNNSATNYKYPHEIIEFPIVLCNLRTLTIVGFKNIFYYYGIL